MFRSRYFWGALLTLLVLGVSVLTYPGLGDRIPIHWNGRGEVDGYGAKQWAAFLGPALMAGMLALFRALPWLSPARFGMEGFRPTAEFIMLLIVGLLGYLHVLSLWASTGAVMDVSRAITAGVFLALALTGNVLGRVEPNFFIGIRTPWTIADGRVWYMTHRLAAWTFTTSGVLGFLLVVLGGWMRVAGVLFGVAVAIPVLFSLVYCKRLERRA
jgi:uncharacterized membrane protein